MVVEVEDQGKRIDTYISERTEYTRSAVVKFL